MSESRIPKDKYRVIYQPRGAALEYSPLALNIYQGCPHGCTYCYVPGCLHKTPSEFYSNYAPRNGLLDKLEADLNEMRMNGDWRTILLCFTCDPYPGSNEDNITTRCVLKLFQQYNQPFQLLTKAGTKAERDFDLYKPGDAFATTLTFLDDAGSKETEPGAAMPFDRIVSLKKAKAMGIQTWVSFEPVIDPEAVYKFYQITKYFVDLFKIGKMNHQKSDIDWRAFGLNMVKMCERDGKAYIIKDALRREMEAR